MYGFLKWAGIIIGLIVGFIKIVEFITPKKESSSTNVKQDHVSVGGDQIIGHTVDVDKSTHTNQESTSLTKLPFE